MPIVGDDVPTSFLLVPAKGRDVEVIAVEDPGLTGRCLRGKGTLPAPELMRAVPQPSRERRHFTTRDGPSTCRRGEAVNLDDDESRWKNLGLVLRTRIARRNETGSKR